MGTRMKRGGWRSVVVASLAVASACAVGGCAGTAREPFRAQAAPAATLSALEGDWVPTREGALVREVEFERERGRWVLEVERRDEVGNEVEETYPVRFLSVGGRTILEVEIARGETPGPESTNAAAFFYGSVEVVDGSLRSSALNPEWLRTYAQTHPTLKVAAVSPWGSERRALGVGRAAGLSQMIEAAAVDNGAWDSPSIWVRPEKD